MLFVWPECYEIDYKRKDADLMMTIDIKDLNKSKMSIENKIIFRKQNMKKLLEDIVKKEY